MRIATAGMILTMAALSVAAVPQHGPARLLRDINTLAGPERASSPNGFVELGGITLFAARTAAEGNELWRTDGTEAGTALVRNISPGVGSGLSGFPSERVGNRVFFYASDGVHGIELWSSDGTEAGTTLVRDIFPGIGSSLGQGTSLTTFPRKRAGGLLYFLARDGSHGTELWRSDGTEAGTVLVKDINPGAGTAFTFPFNERLEGAAVGDTFFFVANDGVHGLDLWRTDGTEAGTVHVKDIPSPGSIQSLSAEVGGLLLFLASDDGLNVELWRSNGTEEGTYTVRDYPGPFAGIRGRAIAMDGALYFVANDGSDFQYRLWKSDGTLEGTAPLAGYANDLIGVFGGKLFFTGYDVVHGYELWVSDGTYEGTGLVKEIVPGTSPFFGSNFTQVGDALFFVRGGELWKTDGTQGGTSLVTSSNRAPRTLREVGGRLYFELEDAGHGAEPWVTDGTGAGTSLLADIFPGPTWSLRFESSAGKVGAKVVFAADDGIHGLDLWATDGTPSGTGLVKDVNPHQRTATGTFMASVGTLGDRFLFLANDGVHGTEPWVSDGTPAGTQPLGDLRPGPTSSAGEGETAFVAWNGRSYFRVDDGVHGWELWVTDGTEAGTHLMRDEDPLWSTVTDLMPLDSSLVFAAYDPVRGYDLWTSDGTESGLQFLADLNPGSDSTALYYGLTRSGNLIYFPALGGPSAVALWRTDGTAAGTFSIPLPDDLIIDTTPVAYKDALWFISNDYRNPPKLWRSDGTIAGTGVVGEIGSFQAFDFKVAGDTLYFLGWDDEAGGEVWRSDGTAEGTYLLKDIFPGWDSSAPSELTPVGDTLFFTAEEPEHGREVWKTDGTEAGTVLVADIEPGHFSSLPTNLKEVAGVVLFSAGLDPTGLEVWRTDGTEAGTYLVQDLLPGPAFSSPRSFVTFGSRVAFSAVDDAAGREAWAARAAILTRQPLRAVHDLADEVRALGLPNGIEQSLIAKLDAAGNALGQRGESRSARRLLEAFAREVEARVAPEEAAELLEFASEIEGLFGESASPVAPRPFRTLEDRPVYLDRAR